MTTPAPTSTSSTSGSTKAKLSYSASENGGRGFNQTITFQFNPATIKVSQNQKLSEKVSLQKLNREEQLKQQGHTTIDVDELIFDGTLTKSRVQTLFNWLKPLPVGEGTNQTEPLKILHFTWGKLDYRCVMENVTATYIRFKSDGTPIRAKVSLKFRTQPLVPSGTNPTSGGLVGRRAHVLTQGDNLQQLAFRTYQTPTSWRAIAEVNGIDDPLRVPVGAMIYLPNVDELDGEPAHG